MATADQKRATVDDLYRTEGKAELIDGRIVEYMATGVRPSEVAANIYVSLRAHAKQRGGKAFTDNIGFVVPLLSSRRESFSPDASYYDGPLPENLMRFVEGSPMFAVEVRSESDYTRSAVAEHAAKRGDYFEAGTEVVWDVDPIAQIVDCYRSQAVERPVRFALAEEANAEPALSGWKMVCTEIFAS